MKYKAQKFIIGIDEVGRGPLAGPVGVCGVLISEKQYRNFKKELKKNLKITLHDSKKLSEKNRELWFKKINEWRKIGFLDFYYCADSAQNIDKIGISNSIKKCVAKILQKLEATNKPTDYKILLDGALHAPQEFLDQKTIIRGDEKEPIISLASIVAKVTRDKYMKKIAYKFAEYDFEINKGYGTLAHRRAIRKYGMTMLHRRSFCRNLH